MTVDTRKQLGKGWRAAIRGLYTGMAVSPFLVLAIQSDLYSVEFFVYEGIGCAAAVLSAIVLARYDLRP